MACSLLFETRIYSKLKKSVSDKMQSQSFSFELLKQELKDKDEIISALKQKLEIMESFHCSSSSFDALNSFQERRSSSIVVIGEDEPIQSPTFKPLKKLESSLKSSKRGSRIFQKQRSNTAGSSFQLVLNSPDSELSLPTSRSASILPSFKQVFIKSFSPKKCDNETTEQKETPLKQSFFRKLFFCKWNSKKSRKSAEVLRENSRSTCFSDSNLIESIDDFCPTYSYDEIISGRAPLDELDIERIEKYLKWDDCIEWLGVTKEQLKLLRTNSLTMRKRSVYLCADQLKNYSKY